MEEARGVILTLLWLWWLLIKPIVDLTCWLRPCCRFPDSRMTALTPIATRADCLKGQLQSCGR